MFVQRDEIGIGGAMSEFVDYIITSLKFGDVRLRLEEQSVDDGTLLRIMIASSILNHSNMF